MWPRCSKRISVRPSPRSASTTVTSSYRSSSGRSENVSTSRAGSSTSRNSPRQRISRRSGPAYIVALHAPPGLTSIETLSSGTSDSLPPNQSANAAGSVHSLQTPSRGESKTRVTVKPWSAIAQPLLHAVEAYVPEAAVPLQPLRCVPERLAAQPRRPQLRGAGALDETGALEHAQVLRDGLDAHRERLRQLADRRLAVGQAREDRAARRVGERGEGPAELVG